MYELERYKEKYGDIDANNLIHAITRGGATNSGRAPINQFDGNGGQEESTFKFITSHNPQANLNTN